MCRSHLREEMERSSSSERKDDASHLNIAKTIDELSAFICDKDVTDLSLPVRNICYYSSGAPLTIHSRVINNLPYATYVWQSFWQTFG